MIFRALQIPIPSHGYGSTSDDLAEIENEGGGGGEPPAPDPVDAAPTPAPAEAPWQAPEYVMLGEERVPWDKAQTYLSQGRNYSQRMHEFNQMREQYKPYEALDRETLDQFKNIHDFVSSGEEGQTWWNHVTQSWDKRNLPPELDPAIEAVVNPLNQQITQLSKTVQDLITEKTNRDAINEDEALDTEIKATRDKFSNIDFTSIDETGVTLEDRVTTYAAENNFPTWRAAFLDYYHDHLMEMQKSEVSKSAAAQGQKDAKKGIVGRSPAPQATGDFKPYDAKRHQSYEDIHRETLAELGLT